MLKSCNIQKITLFLLFSFSFSLVFAQSPYINKSTSIDQNGDYTYTFSANTSLIEQDFPLDYTHPEAAYRYFWSLGDGAYSFSESVEYSYKSNSNVTVRLVGTPVYAPTLPPPAFTSTETVSPGNNSPLNNDEMLLLSRDPRPEFNSYAIINYENILSHSITDAKLRFYFRSDYFSHLEDDLFNNENPLGSTLDTTLLPKYDNYHSYEVGNLISGQKNTIMIDLETLLGAMGGLGEDLPSLYLKAELYYETKDRTGNILTTIVEEQELETMAVGSWDPNDKVALTDDFFYDQMNSQEDVHYQINFQNIGIAPAKSVYIVDTFSQDFDSISFVMTDYYHPKIATYSGFSYTYDSSTRILNAVFSNINLSGVNQPSITNEELTKGYIKFKIQTKRKSLFDPANFTISDSCKPYYRLANKGYITFDNNDAIETNTAYTNFYAYSEAKCLRNIHTQNNNKVYFEAIPNPIRGKQIEIIGKNLSNTFNGFSNANTTVKLYNSSLQSLPCKVNVTYGSASTQNQISINSQCLRKGIYTVLITHNKQLYRVMVVII